MIRMIQSMSAGHAKSYYAEALSKSDYYLEDQELPGLFGGKLATRLGLDGEVTKAQFHALCDNRHPDSGKPLTPRTRAERTVGYDINFHVPKSVSILHALAKDDHILQAFRSSVAATMRQLEMEARARVRQGGRSEDRQTGELLWAEFVHQTARPVEGSVPDPHLHAHCYVFNMTWDETEQRIKAGQFREINRQMPYYQALFHKELADQLMALGYAVRPTEKSFEVEGVPQTAIALFSKRTDEIGRVAKAKGITDAKEKSELGARTRSAKQKGLSMAELRQEWRAQIRQQEATGRQGGAALDRQADQLVRYAAKDAAALARESMSPQACVDYTLAHCFERASVVPITLLEQTALRHALGTGLKPADIRSALAQDSRLIRIQEKGREVCTTKEVLREEQEMVRLANAGKGRVAALYGAVPDMTATGQKRTAIAHILTTRDRVSIVRGAAGTGKTTLMTEAIALIERTGKKVTVVAPTARASRGVLREEGFAKAETVALLLASPEWQSQVKNGVLWVDEAGMLGTKDMLALLRLATEQNARLILGGDTRQHSSVVRGDALRILNTVAHIRPAEVSQNYRQRPEDYRKAVDALAKGDIRDGFERLDGMGAIRKAQTTAAYDDLVRDYIAALKARRDVLVISPTHAQGELVTTGIRKALRDEGLLGKKEIEVLRLRNLNLTEAQKADWRNLQEGLVVQFNQNRKGVGRGSRWRIAHSSQQAVTIRPEQGSKASDPLPLELSRTADFTVYREETIALSKGDKIQITRNGFAQEQKRLDNGYVLDVTAVFKDGHLRLRNPQSKAEYVLEAGFGHLTHAHCITSHAAQGKTVDEVFVAQSAATFPATNAKQFYVSVSRARDKVTIYTDNRGLLLAKAQQEGDRQSALEVTAKANKQHDAAVAQRQRGINPAAPGIEPEQIIQPGGLQPGYDSYEPRL